MSFVDGVEALGAAYSFSPDLVEILKDLYGGEAGRVMEALSRPPPRYYLRVNTLRGGVEEAVKRLNSRGVQVERHRDLEEALYTPVEGPFEVPVYSKRILVDKFTAESVMQGAHVYAPGVVSSRKVRAGDEVTVYDEGGRSVAAGVARMGEHHILAFRRGLAVYVTHPRFKVPCLRETGEFEDGLIYPQSLPAMITTRVLDPRPGETIVDLNCSPGGKLSHICQLTGNHGKVIGVDRSKRKVQRARETLRRMGCRGVSLMVQDSRYLDVDVPGIRADKCLIDPPCSALGVLPKAYETIRRSKVDSMAEYQRQFLKVASRILKPGGVAVYSVCTITPEECEGVVEYAGRKCGFEVASQTPFLGCQGIGEEGELVQRFHPHLHGAGYFISRLQKEE